MVNKLWVLTSSYLNHFISERLPLLSMVSYWWCIFGPTPIPSTAHPTYKHVVLTAVVGPMHCRSDGHVKNSILVHPTYLKLSLGWWGSFKLFELMIDRRLTYIRTLTFIRTCDWTINCTIKLNSTWMHYRNVKSFMASFLDALP